MTFWEFKVACEGFESFHCAPTDEPGSSSPDSASFWKAIGVQMH